MKRYAPFGKIDFYYLVSWLSPVTELDIINGTRNIENPVHSRIEEIQAH